MDWAEIHHILTSRYAADGRYPCRWDQARPGTHPRKKPPMAVITTLILTRHGEAHCNVARVAGGDHSLHRPDRARTASGGTARRPPASRGAVRRAVRDLPATDARVSGNPLRHGSAWQSTSSRASAARTTARPTGSRGTRSKPRSVALPSPIPIGPTRPARKHGTSTSSAPARPLADIVAAPPGQRVLIAGHGETTDAAAMLFLGLAPGFCTRVGFETSHAAITRWHMQRNRLGQELWILAAHNDTRHLGSGS